MEGTDRARGPRPFLAALLACAGAAAQEAAPPRLVTLPGGQRLVLLERPGETLLGAATFVAAGTACEGPGEDGLAAMLAWASLSGTQAVGSAAWEEESKLLRERDALPARHRLPASSGEEAERKERAALEARLRALGDPLAWLAAVERLGAGRLQPWSHAAGFGLAVVLPEGQAERFLALEADRLARPALRGALDGRRPGASAAGEAPADDPGLRARIALLAAAFRHSPLRRALTPAPPGTVSWEQAQGFWRREVLPGRVVLALVGPIPEGLESRLGELFPAAERRGSALALPGMPEPPQAGARDQRDFPEDPPRALLAWRIPPGTDEAALLVLTELLGHPRRGALPARLCRDLGLLDGLRVEAPFPGPGEPALLLVEAVPREGEDGARARELVLDFLGRWEPEATALAEARQRAAIREARARAMPHDLARLLAEAVAAGVEPSACLGLPARMESVRLDQVRSLFQRLFAPELRTTLTTGREAAGRGGGRP